MWGCSMMYQRPQIPQIKILDVLNLIIIFLELRTQMHLQKQASNDDLLRELQKDTDTIIARLEKIEGGNKDE